jgi:HEAT repeat protein
MKEKPNPELLKKLFEHTLSDNPAIRAAAYTAMENFEPDDSIVSCLLSGLEDENPQVRKAAGGALIDLGYLNTMPASKNAG